MYIDLLFIYSNKLLGQLDKMQRVTCEWTTVYK